MPIALRSSSLAASTNHLRARDRHGHGRVTGVELLFDLVFVGLGLLALPILTVSIVTPLQLPAATAAILVMVAVWESISLRHSPQVKAAVHHQGPIREA